MKTYQMFWHDAADTHKCYLQLRVDEFLNYSESDWFLRRHNITARCPCDNEFNLAWTNGAIRWVGRDKVFLPDEQQIFTSYGDNLDHDVVYFQYDVVDFPLEVPKKRVKDGIFDQIGDFSDIK